MNTVNYAVVARGSCADITAMLKNNSYNVLYGAKLKSVPQQVENHIDMQLAIVGNNEYVCCPECYDYYKNALSLTKSNLIKGNTYLSNSYPYDCAYNVAVTKSYAIGNFNYTDNILLNHLESSGRELINVKQGYAKCNICVVDDNSFITSDDGIYKALLKSNLSVLKISSGGILLNGYNYGFIGGCSGTSGDVVYFSGDITKHCDFALICDFVTNKGKKIIHSKNILTDIGTIFFLA